MNDRIHACLDGEISPQALTPDERARLALLESSVNETVAALRAAPAPDLTARIMASLPQPEPVRTAAPGAWQRAVDWFWRPRSFSFSYRPAYAMAGLAAAALAAVMVPVAAPAPFVGPQVVVEGEAGSRLYVQFRLDAPTASQVRLAGSFTGWQPELELREVSPGVWTAMVPLEPGVHDYTFVVDGEEWVPDPYAPHVDDSFGGTNSRLFLPVPAQST